MKLPPINSPDVCMSVKFDFDTSADGSGEIEVTTEAAGFLRSLWTYAIH